MVKEQERKEEEEIINIRINSDDLFQVFGFLSMLSQGIQLPKELTRDVIMECVQRITNLNKNNKEFLEALDSR